MYVHSAVLPEILDQSLLEKKIRALPEAMIKYINKYKQLSDRYRTGTGYLLLKEMLERYYGIEDMDMRFNQYGKPYLNKETIYFNISHSDQSVICAVDVLEVGIDIEKEQEVDKKADIIKRFCTEDEFQQFISQAEDDKKQFFYQFWTAKESYIKYIGQGLSYGLDTFNLKIIKDQDTVRTFISNQSCYFKYYKIEKNYHIHICAKHNNFPEIIEFIKV